MCWAKKPIPAHFILFIHVSSHLTNLNLTKYCYYHGGSTSINFQQQILFHDDHGGHKKKS